MFKTRKGAESMTMQETEAEQKTGVEKAADTLAALQAARVREQQEAALKQREEAITQRESALKEEATKVAAQMKDATATSIAAALNVSKETLLKFTDGSEAAMRELAAQLPKLGSAAPGFTPDSGRTTGAGDVLQGYRTSLREGKPLPSARDIDALTAKYLG